MEYWLKEKIIYQRRFSEGRKKIANDEGVTFAYSRAFLAALLFFLLLTHFWWLEFGSYSRRSMTRQQICLRHPPPLKPNCSQYIFFVWKMTRMSCYGWDSFYCVGVVWLVQREDEHKKAPVGREKALWEIADFYNLIKCKYNGCEAEHRDKMWRGRVKRESDMTEEVSKKKPINLYSTRSRGAVRSLRGTTTICLS